jgi:flagellar biosynthesis protein FlhG
VFRPCDVVGETKNGQHTPLEHDGCSAPESDVATMRLQSGEVQAYENCWTSGCPQWHENWSQLGVAPEQTPRVRVSLVDHHRTTKVFAVASGKGGVGKTTVVANLAFALTKLRKKVLVMDADLGLGNLDILLGLTPQYTMEHLFSGSKSLREIIIAGPGGMRILPASSGVQQLTNLSTEQKLAFLAEIDSLDEPADVMLIDTGSGISNNVLYFALAAQEIIVVACPEPMAIANACAFMKVLACEHSHRKFLLLVNAVTTTQEMETVCQKLQRATQPFPDIDIYPLGWIPHDLHVQRAVNQQKAVVDMYPNALASRAFMQVAMAICALPPITVPSGQIQFFWQRLFR